MLIAIAVGIFISVALLILGMTFRSERDIMRWRLGNQTQAVVIPVSSVETEFARPLSERVIRPFLLRVSRLADRFTPHGAMQSIQDRIEAAGHPWHMSPREFVGLRVLSTMTGAGLALMSLRALNGPAILRFSAAGLLIVIGVLVADMMLSRSANDRKAQIRRSLPDTLDLLMVSVEAGLSLDAAMQKCTEKVHGPLADEMHHALQEMRLGKMRIEALRSMAHRAKVDELTSFVAAIYQADQLGVSISKVLKVQSQSLRSKRTQRAREVAAKLPVKMLFPLVFFIFPALFVVILAPGMIQTAKALGMLK